MAHTVKDVHCCLRGYRRVGFQFREWLVSSARDPFLVRRIRFVYRWFTTAVIPVRLSDDEVKQVDLLVKKEGRTSRSKVIREILREHLTQKLSSDQDVGDLVEALMRLSSKGREPVRLRFKTTVAEAVSEGRAIL